MLTTQVVVINVLLAAAVAYAGYRWYQTDRTRRINTWIKQYLRDRFGSVPSPLSIIATEDQLWPVLVSFRSADDRVRHRLQFSCGGATKSFAFVSETAESR